MSRALEIWLRPKGNVISQRVSSTYCVKDVITYMIQGYTKYNIRLLEFSICENHVNFKSNKITDCT